MAPMRLPVLVFAGALAALSDHLALSIELDVPESALRP